LFVKYYKFMWQHSEHCHPSLPVTFWAKLKKIKRNYSTKYDW
jgi:hypothetical protein